jgi:hypothetical protein
LGLEQSMKHCSFFNDNFTSPEWGPANISTVSTYYNRGEIPLAIAQEMGMPNEWVRPSDLLIEEAFVEEVKDIEDVDKVNDEEASVESE